MPIKENSASQPSITLPIIILMLGVVLLGPSKTVRKIRRRSPKRSGLNYSASRGLRRVICALLIFSLNWASLSAIGSTAAVFSATKTSALLALDTGTLALGLNSNEIGFAPNKIAPDVSAVLNVSLEDLGDIAMQYRVTAQKVAGGVNVCENLMIDAKLDDQSVYSNKLLDLNLGPLAFATTSDETATSTAVWQFGVVFPETAKNLLGMDQSCQFKIMFDSWQTGLPSQSEGFSSHKEITLNILLDQILPKVEVIYPNGGQHWYVVDPACLLNADCRVWCAAPRPDRMNDSCQYNIQWDANNPYGNNEDLRIDLYYSNNSGQSWLATPIETGLMNTGSYLWRLPYKTEYVSHTARIKVVAYDINYPSVRWEGQSASDFCPPMLSIEDLMNQINGLSAEEPANNGGSGPQARSNVSVDPAEITPMTIEEIAGAFDEIRNATSSPEAARDSDAGAAGQTMEIVPFAAPAEASAAQTIEAITGPPAVIPASSNEENATTTPPG